MYLCPNTFYALEYKTESAHEAFYCTHEFHTRKRCRRCDIYRHLFRKGAGNPEFRFNQKGYKMFSIDWRLLDARSRCVVTRSHISSSKTGNRFGIVVPIHDQCFV